MLRYLLWRLLGLAGLLVAIDSIGWLLGGGPGEALRGAHGHAFTLSARGLAGGLAGSAAAVSRAAPPWLRAIAAALVPIAAAGALALAVLRASARRSRRYARMRIDLYRTDRASAAALMSMYAALHRRLQRRWWIRLLEGQPSLALEVHHEPGREARRVWFAVTCPVGAERAVEAAIRGAYRNCRLVPVREEPIAPGVVLRLKKRFEFIRRAKLLDRFEQERSPPMDGLLTVMGACDGRALVQLAITPAPALLERIAGRMFRRREAELARPSAEQPRGRERSMLSQAELRGALEVQHRPLFYVDLRVVAATRDECQLIASELRAETAENPLVERGIAIRDRLLGRYRARIARGEGNPLPCLHKGVFAAPELAALWQLPSSDYSLVPLERGAAPVAPAPPGVFRPPDGPGILEDAFGPVSIHPEMRRQNVAVPGTVEQGKSSFLVASIAEDLRRDRCAVIVLDPKGDAADAALSAVPASRACTLLDLADPTCGFNPLAVDAPADVIADYVVGALKNLFTDVNPILLA